MVPVENVSAPARVEALTGRPDAPRGGFGVALSLAGVVRAPLFSTRAGGTPAVSCRLECGAAFPVQMVDGQTRSEVVHLVEDDVGVLLPGRVPGWLDRAAGAFYTQDALRESGYLPDGRPAAEALACVEATLAAHHLGALVFPQALRLVGYGDLAYRFAEMAPEGAEVAVHAYGRTFRPGGEGPRRFEAVMAYVQFVRGVAWPDGGRDRFAPRAAPGLPARLGPSATVVGLVVEMAYNAGDAGRAPFLTLIVSAAWRPGFDALVTLAAHGACAQALAGAVGRGDLVQAHCDVLVRGHKRTPAPRFLVRDLAVLGHRAEG
ncbi:MAG: hypothetical protein Kow00106_08550 [Anaerolineae bacterium]